MTQATLGRVLLPVAALSAILAILAISAGTARAKDPEPSGRDYQFEGKEESRAIEIQKGFQDAGKELAETHAEALRRDKLQGPLEDLRKAMEKAMLRLEPEKKEQVLRRYEIDREMDQLEEIEKPTELDKEKYQALLLDFTNLTEGLGDLPKQAAKEPDVLEEREKFHKKLLAVMTEINPKVPDLMKQQQTSIGEYKELEQELLKKHMGPKVKLPPIEATTAK